MTADRDALVERLQQAMTLLAERLSVHYEQDAHGVIVGHQYESEWDQQADQFIDETRQAIAALSQAEPPPREATEAVAWIEPDMLTWLAQRRAEGHPGVCNAYSHERDDIPPPHHRVAVYAAPAQHALTAQSAERRDAPGGDAPSQSGMHDHDWQAEARTWRRKYRDELWYWQGDGSDLPESLGCPVIMRADTLRELLAQAARYRYLRDKCECTGPRKPAVYTFDKLRKPLQLMSEALDDAIDAALKETP